MLDLLRGRHSGVGPILAAVVLALFVAGYAACLECDVDSCCEDTEHSEDAPCACGCAYHSLQPVTGQTSCTVVTCGSASAATGPAVDLEVASDLFRPPRIFC